jgi:hypothetical protein
MQVLEQAILETTAAWEHEGITEGQVSAIIGAVDETFLERLMLVFIDLASGYLILEEVAEDRSYETWHTRVHARLETLGTRVWYLLSDRAKALVKLGTTGLGCLSVPDLFHVIHELVKGYGLAISRHLRQAHQALKQARERFDACHASDPSSEASQQAQAAVAACEAQVQHWQEVRHAYQGHLMRLSLIVHPWRVVDSAPQNSPEVQQQLETEIDAVEAFLKTTGLPVKQKTLEKVRKQLGEVWALVDLRWQGVRQSAASQVVLTPMWNHWIETSSFH